MILGKHAWELRANWLCEHPGDEVVIEESEALWMHEQALENIEAQKQSEPVAIFRREENKALYRQVQTYACLHPRGRYVRRTTARRYERTIYEELTADTEALLNLQRGSEDTCKGRMLMHAERWAGV